MISQAVKRACKLAGVKKFVFHNYRNTALTEWSRRGVHVDIAMKASGHTSTIMHKRYLDLKKEDMTAAFGTASKHGIHENGEHKNGEQGASSNARQRTSA